MNLTKFAPSPSACLQAPRSKGGASSLFLQFEFPTAGECARIGKLRAIQHSLTKWRLDQFKLSEEEVAKGISDFMDGNQHILKCCVVAIPEPGKFRVITKGDGFLYTYLQPLQGYLLDAWRSTKFSTMKKADLYQQVNDIDQNVDFFDDWCSGDYEAATDLLNKDACLAALYGLLEYDESNFVMEAIFSMTGSQLHYPNGDSIWAAEGQLMGHPLSFPLLCVTNLAVYLYSVKKWLEQMKHDLLRHCRDNHERQLVRRELCRRAKVLQQNVLVNGDDILFKSDDLLFSIFRETAASCGLKISQGKNYRSKKLCMINSQLFVRKGTEMRRTGYLNQRFLYGMNIKSQKFVGSSPTQIHEGLNKMLDNTPWTQRAIPMIMDRWKDLFKGRFQPNWYLPLHLGGLGINPAFSDKPVKYSREQRLVAAQFVHNPEMSLCRTGKVSIQTAKFISLPKGSVRLVPRASVKTQSESDDALSAWTGRLNYCDRIAGRNTEPTDELILLKFKKSWVKPLSLQKIQYYSDCEWRSETLPPCPPFSSFPYQPLC